MRCRHVALTGLVLSLLTQMALAAPVAATAATATAAALRTPAGGQLTISLKLDGDNQTSTLQLERRDVWKAGAQVVVHTPAGQVRQAPPPTRFFTGKLAGVPGSDVVLALDPTNGRMTGTASRGNAHWSLVAAPAGPTAAAAGVSSGLAARKIPAATGPTAAAAVARPRIRGCGKKAHIKPPGWTSTPTVAAAAAVLPASTGPLQATITVDTDAEFYNLFRSVQDTINYVTLMTTYLDVVYSQEIGVGIRLGQLEIRPNASAPGYPAAFLSVRDAEQGVNAVGNWWNANRQNVPRAATMYLSGKPNVKWVAWAWDEVLCDWHRANQASKPSSNMAYGFVSALEGDFKWSGLGNPTAITSDIFNYAHELGHIFGSPHTHEYCNILGPNTVDDCAVSEGYYFKGQNKPVCPQPNGYGFLPNCTAKPTAVGGGPGTIMSYCDMAGQYSIGHVSMTFGLNHPCGNAPDRVVRTMKEHVALRNTAYSQCLDPNAAPIPSPSPSPSPSPRPSPSPSPSPKPSPSPSPSPRPSPSPSPSPIPRPSPSPSPSPPNPAPGPAIGNWTHPILLPGQLPYTSPTISGWVASRQLPMFCNDTATPLDARSMRTSATRVVKVFRWRSGKNAKGTLTVHSCGLTTQGTPAVSIRATPNSANPLTGPWTCMGAATGGCGGEDPGFRISVQLRPSTVYDIIVVGIGSSAPVFQFTASEKGGQRSAWPAPLGSWTNPQIITTLPFTSAQFSTFHNNTVPAQCTDQVLRSKDALTKYTAPARVFRVWNGAAGKLTITSCANTRAGDNPNVSVRSTANKLAPLDGPWQCVGYNNDGCGTANKGFRLTISAASNTWYYIVVSHTNTVGSPLLKLTVTKS